MTGSLVDRGGKREVEKNLCWSSSAVGDFSFSFSLRSTCARSPDARNGAALPVGQVWWWLVVGCRYQKRKRREAESRLRVKASTDEVSRSTSSDRRKRKKKGEDDDDDKPSENSASTVSARIFSFVNVRPCSPNQSKSLDAVKWREREVHTFSSLTSQQLEIGTGWAPSAITSFPGLSKTGHLSRVAQKDVVFFTNSSPECNCLFLVFFLLVIPYLFCADGHQVTMEKVGSVTFVTVL